MEDPLAYHAGGLERNLKIPAILMLAVSAAGAFAMDTLTILNWDHVITSSMGVANETIQYPGTLPSYFAISIAENEGTSQLVAAASRRKNQAGVTGYDYTATNDYLVRIFTDRPTTSTATIVTRTIGSSTASASIAYYNATAYARGANSIPALQTREVRATIMDVQESHALGPITKQKSWNYSNIQWQQVSAGSQFDAYVPASTLESRASASSPGGGSNAIASSSSASTVAKLKPVALKMPATTGNAGFISGTRDAFLYDIDIEVRNDYNALVDNLSVGGLPSVFHLPFDDYPDGNYRLYFWAPGALRKRIDVSYTNSVGITGLTVNLVYGDIDRNNQISQAEIDAIASLNGRTSTQPGWFDNVPSVGCVVHDCDLNQDKVINVVDYLLAVGNVGLIGD